MAKVEELAPQYLSDADLKPRGRIQLSPVSWRDQVLYQLLPDRFSDGNESERELFDRTNPLRFQVKNKADWISAGQKFVGGTLKGIRNKLDYLQGLGVTTLWINPPWKQRSDLETDQGYGIQNFLDIDSRFGTLQDLRDLIDAAHDRLMYVILDVTYNHSQEIAAWIKAHQYWIALCDCDGFCIDALKQIPLEKVYKFCSAIREYAQSIGKDNFLLTGEITPQTMEEADRDIIGRNLTCVLDTVRAPHVLSLMAKGLAHPDIFFDLYKDNYQAGKYRQRGTYHISVLDDHQSKQRFAAHNNIPHLYEQVAHAVGVQLTMPGIPMIYYGTEQAFDSNEGDDEAMFGGAFGAFQTADCHFFNQEHPTYLRIAAIARLRNNHDRIGKALRRGHHYPRETSFCGYPFSIPNQGELVAWSQILFNTEVLIALNTQAFEDRGAEVTVDASIHPEGSTMTFLYKSDWSDKNLRYSSDDQTVAVHHHDGRATVRIDLPPSGMAILA